jgi:hypothetical protein
MNSSATFITDSNFPQEKGWPQVSLTRRHEVHRPNVIYPEENPEINVLIHKVARACFQQCACRISFLVDPVEFVHTRQALEKGLEQELLVLAPKSKVDENIAHRIRKKIREEIHAKKIKITSDEMELVNTIVKLLLGPAEEKQDPCCICAIL